MNADAPLRYYPIMEEGIPDRAESQSTSQFMPPPSAVVPIEYGQLPAHRSSNGFAIASLVTGVLGCVPFITSILAIAFGIIGIRKARRSAYDGKGLAIAGLVLGIVGVLGWSGFGGLLGYGYLQSKPAAVIAKQFLHDMSAGNINAAHANAPGMTTAQLQTQSSQLNAFGPLQSVSISAFNYSVMNGQSTVHLGGTATFANGTKNCVFDLVKTGSVYKVASYTVQ